MTLWRAPKYNRTMRLGQKKTGADMQLTKEPVKGDCTGIRNDNAYRTESWEQRLHGVVVGGLISGVLSQVQIGRIIMFLFVMMTDWHQEV